MKLKRKIGILMSFALLAIMVACTNAGDTDLSEGADKEIISIGVAPYPQIEVMAAILEEGYQELGYLTERVEGDIGFMFLGLSQGDIDIFPDGWLPVLHGNYIERYEDKLEVGEILYEEASIGITVPSYMEDINTIQDLKDNADLFDKRIVGIEPSAGLMLTATETVEAYDMGEEIELLESSTPAMLAEVDTAIRAEDPIAFLGWRPHTMFSNYDLKILEDDKGIWLVDDVYAVTSIDLEEKAPQVYEFSQKFELSVNDIENILAEAEESGTSIDEIAKKWFKENRQVLDDILKEENRDK